MKTQQNKRLIKLITHNLFPSSNFLRDLMRNPSPKLMGCIYVTARAMHLKTVIDELINDSQ